MVQNDWFVCFNEYRSRQSVCSLLPWWLRFTWATFVSSIFNTSHKSSKFMTCAWPETLSSLSLLHSPYLSVLLNPANCPSHCGWSTLPVCVWWMVRSLITAGKVSEQMGLISEEVCSIKVNTVICHIQVHLNMVKKFFIFVTYFKKWNFHIFLIHTM